jgi:hypothetical protein
MKMLVLVFLFFAAPALAQQKKRAPTVKELQGTIIDLQAQLLACQKEKAVTQEAAISPEAEAVDALQTFHSTISTGLNWSAYRDALIPLKVKIDRLPESDATAPLKRVLREFVDAGHLWNMSIAQTEYMMGGRWVLTASVTPYVIAYPDLWATTTKKAKYLTIADPVNGTSLTGALYVRFFSADLIAKARLDAETILVATDRHF